LIRLVWDWLAGWALVVLLGRDSYTLWPFGCLAIDLSDQGDGRRLPAHFDGLIQKLARSLEGVVARHSAAPK